MPKIYTRWTTSGASATRTYQILSILFRFCFIGAILKNHPEMITPPGGAIIHLTPHRLRIFRTPHFVSDELLFIWIIFLFLKDQKNVFSVVLCFGLIFIWKIVHQDRLWKCYLTWNKFHLYFPLVNPIHLQQANCLQCKKYFITIMKVAFEVEHGLPIFYWWSFVVNSCSHVLAINF